MPSKKKTKKGAEFAARVRSLVDTHMGGNVTRAAKELGVSQRTLHNLYSGDTDDPRLTIIQALLERFPSEDARWILLGEPSEDSQRFEEAVQVRAQHLMSVFWRQFERQKRPLHQPEGRQLPLLEMDPAPSELDLFSKRNPPKRK